MWWRRRRRLLQLGAGRERGAADVRGAVHPTTPTGSSRTRLPCRLSSVSSTYMLSSETAAWSASNRAPSFHGAGEHQRHRGGIDAAGDRFPGSYAEPDGKLPVTRPIAPGDQTQGWTLLDIAPDAGPVTRVQGTTAGGGTAQ